MSERVSVWSGSFRVFGVDVLCDVLDDGTRVIREDSLAELLQAMASDAEPGDVEGLAGWSRGLPVTRSGQQEVK